MTQNTRRPGYEAKSPSGYLHFAIRPYPNEDHEQVTSEIDQLIQVLTGLARGMRTPPH